MGWLQRVSHNLKIQINIKWQALRVNVNSVLIYSCIQMSLIKLPSPSKHPAFPMMLSCGNRFFHAEFWYHFWKDLVPSQLISHFQFPRWFILAWFRILKVCEDFFVVVALPNRVEFWLSLPCTGFIVSLAGTCRGSVERRASETHSGSVRCGLKAANRANWFRIMMLAFLMHIQGRLKKVYEI